MLPMLVERLGPILALLLLLVVLKLSLFGITRLTDWGRLTTCYASRHPFSGRRSWFQSGYIGRQRFSGALAIGGDEDGMYLNLHLVVLVGPAPIFVPWEHIRLSWQQVGLVTMAGLELQECPDVRLKVSRRMAERLVAASGGRLQLPERAA